MINDDYRKSHIEKGIDYHNIFARPHTGMVWRLEKEVLDTIYNKYLSNRYISYLDFACGTGRVLAHFYERVDTATGIDVSEKMVSVALNVLPEAEIIIADITKTGILKDRKFDFISAFRFFPNAEPSLRSEVMRHLSLLLKDNGIIVFNNHLNRSSLYFRLGRLFGKDWHSMIEKEVYDLVDSAGLQVIDKYPIAFLPVNDKWMIGTFNIVEKFERFAMQFIGRYPQIAQDIIYVCMKR